MSDLGGKFFELALAIFSSDLHMITIDITGKVPKHCNINIFEYRNTSNLSNAKSITGTILEDIDIIQTENTYKIWTTRPFSLDCNGCFTPSNLTKTNKVTCRILEVSRICAGKISR